MWSFCQPNTSWAWLKARIPSNRRRNAIIYRRCKGKNNMGGNHYLNSRRPSSFLQRGQGNYIIANWFTTRCQPAKLSIHWWAYNRSDNIHVHSLFYRSRMVCRRFDYIGNKWYSFSPNKLLGRNLLNSIWTLLLFHSFSSFCNSLIQTGKIRTYIRYETS